MKPKRARSNSWSNAPMPAATEAIPFEQTYPAAAYNKIKRGFIPDELEDPWFIYFEEGWLYVHPNDGVGQCVYQVRFEQRDDQYQAVEAWASRDEPGKLPGDDDSLFFFADIYNRSKVRGAGSNPLAALGQRPKPTGQQRTTAQKDAAILQYLIDHWLVDQPWKK